MQDVPCRWVDRDEEILKTETLKAEIGGQKSEVGQMLTRIDRKISAVQKSLRTATGQPNLGQVTFPSVEKAEPASDDEARRLFALLKALESESYYRKAPVTRVFQLYCLDGLTRDKVAKKCRCAPSLVTLRLRAIEFKLGRKVSALRQISDHFDQIADSISDDRARHIHRPNALDDPGDGSEDG